MPGKIPKKAFLEGGFRLPIGLKPFQEEPIRVVFLGVLLGALGTALLGRGRFGG
jgi:hypothetical protein